MKNLFAKFPALKTIGKPVRSFFRTGFGKYKLMWNSRSDDLKIIVGSSGTAYPGWVITDLEYLNLLIPSDWERAFRRDSIKAILAEHVWEHLSLQDGLVAAKQCWDYLKPGGHLRLAVPDGFNPSEKYIDYVKVGGSGDGADDHKVLYDKNSMGKLLIDAGFEIDLLEYFDEEGQFHHKDWELEAGLITRSRRLDPRNVDGKLNYTSLIVDAIKPLH